MTMSGFNGQGNGHGGGRHSGRIGAYVLIGLGAFGLLAGTGVLKVLGGLIGGALLGAIAYLAYTEGRRTGNTVWRVAAYPLAGLAIATIVPGSMGGGAFLAGLGLAFALVWREDQTRWWALIPAGALASLAAVAFFQGAVGWSLGWLFLLGLAATFYLLTRLEVEPQPWAIYPAAALAVVSVLSFTTAGGWVVPLAMIAIGGWLLYKGQLGGVGGTQGHAGAPAPVSAPVPAAAQPDDARSPGSEATYEAAPERGEEPGSQGPEEPRSGTY